MQSSIPSNEFYTSIAFRPNISPGYHSSPKALHISNRESHDQAKQQGPRSSDTVSSPGNIVLQVSPSTSRSSNRKRNHQQSLGLESDPVCNHSKKQRNVYPGNSHVAVSRPNKNPSNVSGIVANAEAVNTVLMASSSSQHQSKSSKAKGKERIHMDDINPFSTFHDDQATSVYNDLLNIDTSFFDESELQGHASSFIGSHGPILSSPNPPFHDQPFRLSPRSSSPIGRPALRPISVNVHRASTAPPVGNSGPSIKQQGLPYALSSSTEPVHVRSIVQDELKKCGLPNINLDQLRTVLEAMSSSSVSSNGRPSTPQSPAQSSNSQVSPATPRASTDTPHTQPLINAMAPPPKPMPQDQALLSDQEVLDIIRDQRISGSMRWYRAPHVFTQSGVLRFEFRRLENQLSEQDKLRVVAKPRYRTRGRRDIQR